MSVHSKQALLFRETAPAPSWPEVCARLDAPAGEPVFYWEKPSCDFGIAAIGAVEEISVDGPERFARAERRLSELADSLEGDGATSPLPLAVGGFSFSHHRSTAAEWRGFPALRLVVPRVLWVRRGEEVRTVCTWESGGEAATRALLEAALGGEPVRHVRRRLAVIDSADSETAEAWHDRVGRVLGLIREGRTDKIVLARNRTLLLDGEMAPGVLLSRLCADRPQCANFRLSMAGVHFVGSSPESLVHVSGTSAVADALAGSAGRGRSETEDAGIADRLRASSKDRREHDLVVRAVVRALEPYASAIDCATEPSLLRLPEVQHLHTRVRAELNRPLGVLAAAARLHPTPAVCGVPTGLAREFIEAAEPWRGWYTGGVGWVGAGGEGEFSVALRAALLDGRRVVTWAGAGIVDGSDPPSELEEVECKMSGLLAFLDTAVDVRAA